MKTMLLAGIGGRVLMAGVAFAGETAEVSSTSLRMTVDGRGAVSRLVTNGGVELGGAKATSLFKGEFTRTDDFTARKWADAAEAGKVETRVVEGGVDVVYSGFAADRPVERVVCRMRGERDGRRVRFGLTTVTRSGWALTAADYPRLQLTRRIGTRADDDAFLTGDVFGGGPGVGKAVIRHPADPARKDWRLSYGFPGNLTVQFAEFYDPSAGLVFAAEDAEGAPKAFHAVRTDDGFVVDWSSREWSPGVATRSYDVTLAAFEGTREEPATWHDGADVYREWASRQRWCAKPIQGRADLPAWLKDAPALTMFMREAWFDRPENIRSWLGDYLAKRHPGVPTVAALWGWEKFSTWVGFDYFPCNPSDETMRSLTDAMRAAGVHAYPWPSGYFWTTKFGRRADGSFAFDDAAAFARTGAAHAVVGRDGEVEVYRNWWLRGGEAYELCGGDPWTIPWVTEKVGRGLARRGCELIQGDQLNGGAFHDCWSKTHGHPPGSGAWKARAARRQLEEMRRAIAETHPTGGVVTYEEANETLNDLCGIQLVRRPKTKEPVEKANPYTYLHHEYLPMFGANPQRADWDWAAYSVAEGLMPRFIPATSDFGGLAVPSDFYAAVREVETTGTNRFHYGENADATDAAFRPGRRFRLSADLETLRCGRDASLSLDFGVYTCELKALVSEHQPFPKAGAGKVRVSREFTMPEGAAHILRVMVNCRGDAKGRLGGFALEALSPDGSASPVRSEGNARYEGFMTRWLALYRGEGRPFLAHGRHVKPPVVKCAAQTNGDSLPGAPSVYAGAFEAVDGTQRRAAVFANATDRPQSVTWTLRGESGQFELEPSGIRLVPLAAEAGRLPSAAVAQDRFGYSSWWASPGYWRRRNELKLGEIRRAKRPFDLVLVGDSITQNWEGWVDGESNSNLLYHIARGRISRAEAHVEPMKNWTLLTNEFSVLNLGTSGDDTRHVIWRLTKGRQLDGYRARFFAVMVGTNNLSDSPEDVAAAIGEIVRIIRERHPESTVLLHPIFPRGARPNDPRRKANEAVNARIRRLTDPPRVVWCDFNARLLGPDGVLSREVMSDLLHPCECGYAIWREELVRHLRIADR